LSSTEKQADVRLEAWGKNRKPSHPDVMLLMELRFALQTMLVSRGVLNSRMLMAAVSLRIARLEEDKNKTQE